jgi:NAD(P)-dependent dehydrogenase (short-subunit alcohol dehydrogenase family)
MSWEGKVVVVTGGATGIGAATSRLFAENGAKVVILDLNDGAAEENVGAIKSKGGTALHVRGSVAAEGDVKALAEKAVAAFGRIDGLVNNAGIMRRHDDLESWTMDEVRQVVDVNLLGLFYTTYALGPIIARDGGGAIVNISSIGGIVGVPCSPVYAAAKAGVLGLTRSVAPMLGPMGVRVNAMLPNFVDTPMTVDSPSRAFLPMLQPIDIARGVLHLASDPELNGAFFTVGLVDGKPALSRVSDSPAFTPVESPLFKS